MGSPLCTSENSLGQKHFQIVALQDRIWKKTPAIPDHASLSWGQVTLLTRQRIFFFFPLPAFFEWLSKSKCHSGKHPVSRNSHHSAHLPCRCVYPQLCDVKYWGISSYQALPSATKWKTWKISPAQESWVETDRITKFTLGLWSFGEGSHLWISQHLFT